LIINFILTFFITHLDTSVVSISPTSPVINNGINNSVDTIKSDSTADTTQSTGHLSEMDKKIRNLTKKLRQIEELKERQKNGDKLELTQIKKNRDRSNITERVGTFETLIDFILIKSMIFNEFITLNKA